jgi:decaprenylphospho-beta-D-ribofuranose 2-oxidase
MRWKTAEYSGWGRARRASGELARPERQPDLSEIMARSPCPALGNLRSYGDACLNDGGRAVLTTRLDRLLDFDPDTGTVEAEAGVTIGDLARVMAPRGWLPPVMPGTGHATLGGCLANDVHGKNHHRDGTFGQHVTEIVLIAPDGAERRVAAGTPLFRATAGGLGQTGAIRSLRLRLARIPGSAMRVDERRLTGWADTVAALAGSDAPYCVAWIDATASGAALGRGILEEARHSGGDVLRPSRPALRLGRAVPPGLLSRRAVRAFNALYLRQVPAGGRSRDLPFDRFFFPLDRVGDWNRLYGKHGFHQFQCVVPPDAAAALRAMLERVAADGLAPLAVLKRMGGGHAGFLSFPMEGWTLALDLPAGSAADRLLPLFEAMTLDAGGRIYLAKDGAAGADGMSRMYPDLAEWAAVADDRDPDRRLATDLVRRLRLRDRP